MYPTVGHCISAFEEEHTVKFQSQTLGVSRGKGSVDFQDARLLYHFQRDSEHGRSVRRVPSGDRFGALGKSTFSWKPLQYHDEQLGGVLKCRVA